MNGFDSQNLLYELRVYAFTDNPDFYNQKFAGETPKLLSIPFNVAWMGSLDKTDDRACCISTAIWGILHLRDEDLLPEIESALEQSIEHVLNVAKELPQDISGKLFRLRQSKFPLRALYSYSTQPVTDNLKETPIAPALERIRA